MKHYKVSNIRYSKKVKAEDLPTTVIVEVEDKANDIDIIRAVEKQVGALPVSCNISMIQD